MGKNRDAIDEVRHHLGERGHAASRASSPRAEPGGLVRRQAILDAFAYRRTQKVVRRRERNRQTAGTADDDFVRLNISFAAAVGTQQRQVNCFGVSWLAEQPRLDLVRSANAAIMAGWCSGLRGGKKASVGGSEHMILRVPRK